MRTDLESLLSHVTWTNRHTENTTHALVDADRVIHRKTVNKNRNFGSRKLVRRDAFQAELLVILKCNIAQERRTVS